MQQNQETLQNCITKLFHYKIISLNSQKALVSNQLVPYAFLTKEVYQLEHKIQHSAIIIKQTTSTSNATLSNSLTQSYLFMINAYGKQITMYRILCTGYDDQLATNAVVRIFIRYKSQISSLNIFKLYWKLTTHIQTHSHWKLNIGSLTLATCKCKKQTLTLQKLREIIVCYKKVYGIFDISMDFYATQRNLSRRQNSFIKKCVITTQPHTTVYSTQEIHMNLDHKYVRIRNNPIQTFCKLKTTLYTYIIQVGLCNNAYMKICILRIYTYILLLKHMQENIG
eukprot:TRINITY_DN1726_c1_g1_i6.p1 TRINITY_DN1726_c1_g1~~TRINITY_DN1726_c1_g1_i6.p1  ORF type:complete len:282 (+),score=-29.11 TRINITY_DN1726_c1_g1_i6:467-1312(+)